MKRIITATFSLVLSLTAFAAAKVEFVNISDSTDYIPGDYMKCTDAPPMLTIRTDYTLPISGIKQADVLKMADILMNIADGNYDADGNPIPSEFVQYDDKVWTVASHSDLADFSEWKSKCFPDEAPYQEWSESPAIKPIYNDGKRLSMLASNYMYTGGAHGLYYDFTVNYSVTDGKFVTIDDILPDFNFQDIRSYYDNAFSPILTEKAKKILSDPDGGCVLLVDSVLLSTNFAFTPDGIVMRYQPYSIAPWAAGVVEIPLSYKEIAKIVAKRPSL